MCGIVFRKNFKHKPVARKIRRQYFKQKSRGTDGYGFVAINNGGLIYCRSKYEHQIMSHLKENATADEIMFHHRIPTSTINTADTAHPISTDRNKIYKHRYYLIHNGIIHNAKELQKQHQENFGIRYTTEVSVKSGKTREKMFNDSEALLHELALYIEGKKEKVETQGSVAFILLETDRKRKPLNLYFGRNTGNPLNIQYDKKNYLSLSSEGEGVSLRANLLFKLDYATNDITQSELSLAEWKWENYKTIDDDMSIVNWADNSDIDLDKTDEKEIRQYFKKLTNEELGYLRATWVDQYDEIEAEENKYNALGNYDEEEEARNNRLEMSYQIKLLDEEITKRVLNDVDNDSGYGLA